LYFITSYGELESIKAVLLQAMDSTSKKVRLAVAQSLVSILLSVMTEEQTADTLGDNDVQEIKKKRPNHPVKAEEPDSGRSSPALGKSPSSTKFRVDFRDLLRQLSASYARSNNRRVRTGIVLSYTILFKALGAQFVSTNYLTILEHLLNDVAIHPLLGEDRFRTLETRSHVKYLLGDVLRRQLFNERAKLMTLRTIINVLVEKQNQEGVDPDMWPAEAIVSAVTEIAGIIQDMGSAISLEQVFH
jgi:hypothetical protein